MKTCLRCQTAKPFTDFSLNTKGRYGLHPWCKECVREYSKMRYTVGLSPSKYVRKSQSFRVDYIPPRKDTTEIKKGSPGFFTADRAWRRIQKKGQVPPWVKFEEVLPLYEAAALAKHYVVDHIVPLHGKNVRGLHVPWNLQLLTPYENSVKHAKHPSSNL